MIKAGLSTNYDTKVHLFLKNQSAFRNPYGRSYGRSLHSKNLIEPVSEKELEVLQLLAAGLSNQEIAANCTSLLTRSKYTLRARPTAVGLQLVILNSLGQEVARLVNGGHAAGRNHVTWQTDGYASGRYFYRLRTRTVKEKFI
jgi:hypothetical protein